ncbi:uncharacterized protein LOC131313408 isoform X2 [Rhododendron vialii]|uniref:uncharacterized protein LOC131313408 isoform X1 n=1 Tax=Rhododendron vialii TaxID=182163 RepID=UPI00265F5F6F|nr:uncharacterized protein LOC131313408 isoform X1 [Rhododendron vialii]XP_058197681.1 uncharacterized protein LOC131313408 isoform X2 [Rhododendron vialii]
MCFLFSFVGRHALVYRESDERRYSIGRGRGKPGSHIPNPHRRHTLASSQNPNPNLLSHRLLRARPGVSIFFDHIAAPDVQRRVADADRSLRLQIARGKNRCKGLGFLFLFLALVVTTIDNSN